MKIKPKELLTMDRKEGLCIGEITSWLVDNPDEAAKLRNLLMTKDEVIRRAAVLLKEVMEETILSPFVIVGPLTENLTARQIMSLKQQLELVAFDRQSSDSISDRAGI